MLIIIIISLYSGYEAHSLITVIICLLNKIFSFATFEKFRRGAERKLRNIFYYS